MKAFLSILCLTCIFTNSAFSQNILLVDNTAGRPGGAHVFGSIQDAVNAASAGDIIHVKPSAVEYADVTIELANDSISIFGIGFNPDKEGPLTSRVRDIYVRGNNVRISGLVFRTLYAGWNLSGTNGFSNLSLDNCVAEEIYVGDANDFFNNVIIRNNIIGNLGTAHTNTVAVNIGTASSQVILTNNIFTGDITPSTSGNDGTLSCNGCIVKNNLFLGNGEATRFALHAVSNATISNNIFLGRNPQGRSSLSNTSFKNNLIVLASDSSLSTTNGNSVSGTINTIATFEEVFLDTAIRAQDRWDLSWDPALEATELIGTGTDGTDIGPTGSTIPFNTTGTPLPFIESLIVPEIIREGDSLSVKLRAVGGN